MKQVRVKADESQTITAIYEFLHDLDNEYSNFSKWYYSTVVPELASENRIIYTVLDDGKIVAVLIVNYSAIELPSIKRRGLTLDFPRA